MVNSLGSIGSSVDTLMQFVSTAAGAVEEQGSALIEISSNMQAASTDVAGITRSLGDEAEMAA